MLTYAAHAQTFQVLHTFEGSDGMAPGALVMDSSGNLYGTASAGGIKNCSSFGCGTVFELSASHSGWTFRTLYEFQSRADGWAPAAPLTIGPAGVFYGATVDDGIEGGGGTVFRLSPICADPACKQTTWIKATLYRFEGCDGDGTNGGLVLDQTGNLYGTTIAGCSRTGQVFELSPAQGLQNNWTKTVIHGFVGPPDDGRWELGTLFIDKSGTLFAPTFAGGSSDLGTIYRVTLQSNSWKEDLLKVFLPQGGNHPVGNLISDSSGSFYGVTYGDQQPSTAFKLTNSQGSWVLTQLHAFLSGEAGELASGLVMDKAGNLYGVGDGGAHGFGAVYKLTHTLNGWSYSTLYDFTGGSDGSMPSGPLALDVNGNLYGSAMKSGDHNCNNGTGCGTLWVIKP